MAWLELKGNVYQISFRWDGRKFRRSLGTTQKTDADARLVHIDRRLALIEQGDLIVPDGTDLLSFVMTDGKPQPKIALPTKELTLLELFEQYRTMILADSMERNSWYTVTIHLKHLETLLGSKFPVAKLSLVDLQQYVDRRMKQPGRRGRLLSPTTIKKELSSFSGVWTWAIPRGLVTGPFPNQGLRYSKLDHKPPFQTRTEIERQIERGGLSEIETAELWDGLYLTLDEIDQVLRHVESAARHPFLFPMVLMAAHTGARRSELIRSQVSDFDFSAGIVHIREKKRGRGQRSLRVLPPLELEFLIGRVNHSRLEILPMKTRRHFSPDQKATIVRRHLAAKEPVSNLAEEFGVQPSQIHLWVKQLLDQADRAFLANQPRKNVANAEQLRVVALEAELVCKNAVISELLEQFGRMLVARHSNAA